MQIEIYLLVTVVLIKNSKVIINIGNETNFLGITVLPFSATLEILDGQWLFGRTFCHIWLAIDVLYCTASIYGLMFISIERYIGVTRPLRYPLIITRRRTIFAILTAWLISMLISIVPFLGWHNEVKSTNKICLVNDNLSFTLFSCLFSFYIPLIIIVCVYGRIYCEAIRQYQFLSGGEKKVRLKETVGQECITLRIHIPQHLSTSMTSLSSGKLSNTGITTNGQLISTQITSTGTNKLTRFKRERKAGKRK
jgi:adrenergic receptor alpha-1D